MDLLDKLKKIFKKKKQTNNTNNNSIITTENNSRDYKFRGYNELTRRERRKISIGVKKLASNNNIYLFYNTKKQDDEAQYLNNLFFYLMKEYYGIFEKIPKDNPPYATAMRIHYSLISSSEFKIISDALNKIKCEYEVKYYTLVKFIENLEKTKNETFEYTSYMAFLNQKKERLETCIMRLVNLLIYIDRTIVRCTNLANQYYLLNRCNRKLIIKNENSLKTEENLIQLIIHCIDDSGWTDKIVEAVKTRILNRIDSFNADFDDSLLKKINRQCKTNYVNPQNGKTRKKYFTKYFETIRKPEIAAWEYLIKELSNDLLLELYDILAKYTYYDDANKFKHLDDYKMYIKDVENLTNECLNTPTKKWKDIYIYLLHFKCEGNCYLKKYENHLTDEIKEQLRVAFARLSWLYEILHDPDFNIEEDKYLCNPEFDLKLSDEDVHRYYDQFSDELLTKVEKKFDTKLSELGFLKKDKDYRRVFALNRHSLIDLLNDAYKKAIYCAPSDECPFVYKQNNSKKTIIYPGNTQISLTGFYYLLKLKNISVNEIDFSKIAPFNKWYHQKTNDAFINYVALIRLKKLEKDYDSRILIAPKIDDIDITNDYWKQLVSTDNHYIAVLAPNIDIIDDFITKTTIPEKIKYLFVRKRDVDEYKKDADEYLANYPDHISKVKDNLRNKGIAIISKIMVRTTIYLSYFQNCTDHIKCKNFEIIIIPDNTTCSELSDILNQELAKSIDEKHLEKIAQ